MEAVMLSTCTMYQGDCLKILPTLINQDIDMVFADLPYACTRQDWDINIDLTQLWIDLKRVCNKKAAQCLTATQPFSSKLIASNMKSFRYDLIWLKSTPTGFLNAARMPLRAHESVLVFYNRLPTYIAQTTPAAKMQGGAARCATSKTKNWGVFDKKTKPWNESGFRLPLSYQMFPSEKRQLSLHPTQKPVALLEWLIKTYTNPGDTVLDPVFGSCTTGVACARLGRNFIGIEKDPIYFQVGADRVNAERSRLDLPAAHLVLKP